jgi:Hydrazine synthase alpha subunit middle domain
MWFSCRASAQSVPDIVFVTQIPDPDDFRSINATFANHLATLDAAPRGGDLYVRYSDGTLKNITALAGFGSATHQGPGAISVRDPVVHWDGRKVLFSMVIGAPSTRYEQKQYRWQLYEATGLGRGERPVVRKVPRQPVEYNNIMPAYTSNDQIIFVSDRPRDGARHLYPQVDEYESTFTNTGLWSLNPANGQIRILDNSPSGDFHPMVDSFGRVVFTRWDHLQRDQQADDSGNLFGAFNYASEQPGAARVTRREIFPEPRSTNMGALPGVNTFNINRFFPWEMNQDGSHVMSLNHLGRHELISYFNRSFETDGNLREFIDFQSPRKNKRSITGLYNFREDPRSRGVYYAVNAPEFETLSAGQIVALNAAPGQSADNTVITDITHPATANPGGGAGHSGMYRNPLPTSTGALIAAHAPSTGVSQNMGSAISPNPTYRFRLRVLRKEGAHFTPGAMLTGGIRKSITMWSPDNMGSYSGELWELQPVELRPRPRPPLRNKGIEGPEQGVLSQLGVNVNELQNFLRAQDVALVVARNVTSRDRNDKQQPFNLRVPNGTQTVANGGKVWDISGMQFLQGNAIRGYTSRALPGRRILPEILFSRLGFNNLKSMWSRGNFKIAPDGSVAAIVPARRAMTWQLMSPQGQPVVRERVWVTFKPGEVRACGSCHGANTANQVGRPEPQNSPQALRGVIQYLRSQRFIR